MRADQPRERLAAGVFEHQQGPTVFDDEFQRPHHPGAIELTLQVIVTTEAIEDGGRRMLRGGRQDKYSAAVDIGALAASSAQDAFAVLPQDFEVIVQ